MEKKVKLSFEDELVSLMPKLENYARYLTKNLHNSEDLVQQTLLLALNNKSKFDPETNLKGWLTTIMHNLFINGYRHRVKFGNKVEYNELKVKSYSIESEIDNKLYLEHVNEFISHQKNRLIEPITLFAQGYQYEEIAEMTGVNINTVKTRIFQMRRKLSAIA